MTFGSSGSSGNSPGRWEVQATCSSSKVFFARDSVWDTEVNQTFSIGASECMKVMGLATDFCGTEAGSTQFNIFTNTCQSSLVQKRMLISESRIQETKSP